MDVDFVWRSLLAMPDIGLIWYLFILQVPAGHALVIMNEKCKKCTCTKNKRSPFRHHPAQLCKLFRHPV